MIEFADDVRHISDDIGHIGSVVLGHEFSCKRLFLLSTAAWVCDVQKSLWYNEH